MSEGRCNIGGLALDLSTQSLEKTRNLTYLYHSQSPQSEGR